MWSMSGGGDVFKLFFNSLAIQGVYKGNTTYSDDNPAMFDMLRRGDAGFMPMSWKGTVQEIKPIGQKSLLVYGDTGISLLNWYNEFLTYGEVVISHIGVANKGGCWWRYRTATFCRWSGRCMVSCRRKTS